MIRNKKILIVGAGGFIGGHLVDRLIKDGNSIVADIKPKEYWFQDFNEAENHYDDMKDISNCKRVTKNIDYVFKVCNMVWALLKIIKELCNLF